MGILPMIGSFSFLFLLIFLPAVPVPARPPSLTKEND
jgi:hypothetical protein